MMKRWVVIGLLGVLIGVPSWAQTLEECQQLACDHYPEIRQYDLIRQSEQYDLSNAARSWLPQVSFSAQATWQNRVPEFPSALSGMLDQAGVSLRGLDKDQYKVALEVNQTIWDGGQSQADRRVIEATADEHRQATEVDLYAVKGRVNDLYFGILLLEERLGQTDLTIALLQSNLDKVRSLVTNGVAMQTDADAVEAELLSVQQQRVQIEASRESYRRMLELFIGQRLAERLERPELVEAVSGESARPELAWIDAQQERLAAQELSVKSATRPRFGVFAQGYYGYPGLDYFAGMILTDWTWNALIGVKMSWNFGAYYTKKNRLSNLRVAKQQLDIQRDVFLFNTDLQVAEEQGNISRLRRALADDDRIVALRRSVREAAESKLRNGVIDTNDLLRKITDEASARSARSLREVELLKAIYELKYTINR
jgi:outer membrane protein TolC